MTDLRAQPAASPEPATASGPGFREKLRGYGPVGIIVSLVLTAVGIVMAPVGAVLVLVWAWASKLPFADIGFVRPKSWVRTIFFGIVLGLVLKFVMKAIVLPLLGADAVNHTFHYIAGDPKQAAFFAVYVIFGAGFAEEIFFRGYLFERIGKLIGTGFFASIVALLVATALFGGLHYGQGYMGIVNALIVGFIVGAIFLITGRNLWVPIVMHAAFDVSSVIMIYYDAEEAFSHLIFK